MDDSNEIKATAPRWRDELAAELSGLLEILLADAAADVEVVARELGLKDGMRERLGRALDRVECARGVVEAMREVGVWRLGQAPEEVRSGSSGCGDRDVGADEDHRRDDALDAMERVRDAVELLAGDWPQDYPEGAVEWLIFEKERAPA
ncbi:hypothetical protein [Caballeronia glebae]|uniref:hypothetical protein n=1 Tax=Caballeronia glebae TaxID=1777143 RepID=UPI0038BDE9EE